MFIGQYSNKIDDKGRLAIPSKFRADLVSGAVVTKGLDGCLFIYTPDQWNKLTERIDTLPLTAEKARAFSRHLLAGAMELELDKQGRVVLPSYLREFAQIASSVVVAGVSSRLEVWGEQAWNAYQSKNETEVNEIAEGLML